MDNYFYKKYIKYKNKYIKLGGTIYKNNSFQNINSIGFEFETNQLLPLTNKPNTNELEPLPFENNYYSDYELQIKSDKSVHMNEVYKKNSYKLKIYDDTAKIEEFKLELYDNYNTEFDIVFKTIDKSENIVIEKFIDATQRIKKVFNDTKIYKCVITDLNDKIVKETCVFKLVKHNLFIIYKNDNNIAIDIENITNVIHSILFDTQTTLGVHIDNIYDVMLYLLYNTEKTNTTTTDLTYIKVISEKLLEHINNILIKYELKNLLDEFNKNKKSLLNWFILVLYQVNNIILLLTKLEKKDDKTIKEEITYKFYAGIIIRHSIQNVFPLSSTMKEFLAKVFDFSNGYFINNIDLDFDNNKLKKYTEYINILFKNNKLNNNEDVMTFSINQTDNFNIISTFFDYDKEKKIIYLEYRRLIFNLYEIDESIKQKLVYTKDRRKRILGPYFRLSHLMNFTDKNKISKKTINLKINNKPINIKWIQKNIDNDVLLKLYINEHKSVQNLLFYAYENKHFDIVKLLINNDKYLNNIDEQRNNILMLACRDNNIELVKLLVPNKIKTNSLFSLFSKKISLDATNIFNDTSLIIASSYGHSEIVKILLDNNANINIKNNLDEDSLILASKDCHYDVIKLLKDNKKLIISKDVQNKTAYDNAKDSKCDEKVLDLLKP